MSSIILRLLFLVTIFTILLNGDSFIKEISAKKFESLPHNKHKDWCFVCGMSIKKYYKTSYQIKTKHKHFRQYCSLRCLIMDNKNNLSNIHIMTIDAKTSKQIRAKNAIYLVGSNIKGTMSKVSKLAFKKKIYAKEFQKKYGGKIVSFNGAILIAKNSLDDDNIAIEKKRIKKAYPMGKKIFSKRCNKDIKISDFNTISNLKYALKNRLCKNLTLKQLQATTLYLWNNKKIKNRDQYKSIKVFKNEKCPICGMFVYKYPKWATQIFFKNQNKISHYSFDGVKDMMKFYLNLDDNKKNNIIKILVTDYYLQESLDATKAFYVVGSNVHGPMGNELIPFKNYQDAKIFKQDHKAKKIIKYKDIDKNLIRSL